MKKVISILTASFILCINIAGCSSTANISSDILSDNENPALIADSFAETEGTGIPQSYEELQDFIRPYPSVNYLGFEIIKRYSPEEAFEITNDDMFLYGNHVI